LEKAPVRPPGTVHRDAACAAPLVDMAKDSAGASLAVAGGLAIWRSRSKKKKKKSPPVNSRRNLLAGGSFNSKAIEAASLATGKLESPLVCALKPFGKGGVRVAWKINGVTLSQDSLCLEARIRNEWVTCESIEHDRSSVSGVKVIRQVTVLEGQPPARTAWRLRSGSGGLSDEVLGWGSSSASKAAASSSSTNLWKKTSGEAPPPTVDGREAATSVNLAGNALAEAPAGSGGSGGDARALLALLHAREAEVCQYLLRPAIDDASSLQKVRGEVEAAVAFDDELATRAHASGQSKGKVFQALLEALRQQGASHAQLDNSSKDVLAGTGAEHAREAFNLSIMEWFSMLQRADALRNLVRIKVADDNDLRTARSGLELAVEFFQALHRLASLRGDLDEFELLREVRLSA
jgi:hypothetical protein